MSGHVRRKERSMYREKVQVNSKHGSHGICGRPIECCCSYGVARLQGKRPSMEDRTLILPMVSSGMTVFGVFDGHDGVQAADFTIRRLSSVLEDSVSEIQSKPDELFKRLMQEIDNKFCASAVSKHIYSGTTALIAVMLELENGDKRLIVSNVGDSQAYMCVQGKAKSVSICHKPEMEASRITAAGGWLCEERETKQQGECVTWRLNGGMSLSRAIGDVEYKKLKNVYAKSAGCDWDFPPGHSKNFTADLVIAEPDVYVCDVTPKDDFIILASDGLWDVMDGETAVKHSCSMLTDGCSAEIIADKLAEEATALGSLDNVTVIIIMFWQ